MSFGISVVNTNNLIVIDQDYANYAIFEEGTILNDSGPLDTIYSDELVYYTIDGNGGWASFAVISGYWMVGGTLKYIRMRPLNSINNPGSESFGIRVFDEQNRTIFDSSSRYVKPVGMYSYMPMGSYSTYSLPTPASGKRLWFSGQIFKFIENVQNGEVGSSFCTGITRNSATSWTLKNDYESWGPPADFINTYSPFFFLVIEA